MTPSVESIVPEFYGNSQVLEGAIGFAVSQRISFSILHSKALIASLRLQVY